MSKKCIQVAASKRAKAHIRCYTVKDSDKSKKSDKSKSERGGGGGSAPASTIPSHDPKDYNSAVSAFEKFASSDEQKDAIMYYTKEGYRPLNACRRRNQACHAVDFGKAMTLQKTLLEAPKFEGEVFRGVTFSSKERMDDFVSQFKKGGIYVDPGFMSTSINKNIANNFGSDDIFSVSLKIRSKKGVAIKSLSDIKSEDEVLFNANSKFSVKNIKKGKGTFEIELDNLDD